MEGRVRGLIFDLNNNTYLLANSNTQDGDSYLVLIKNPKNGLSYFNDAIASFSLLIMGLSVLITMIILIWKIKEKKF